MIRLQERFRQKRLTTPILGAFLLVFSAGCKPAGDIRAEGQAPTVRIGVGPIGEKGLKDFISNLTIEQFARVREDGRMEPGLAQDWSESPDRLSLTVTLRSGVTFHDGSPLTAAVVAEALKKNLGYTMGSTAEDVESITAISDSQILIKLKHPTPFALEALETPIRNPDAEQIGTAAFMLAPGSSNELVANAGYYQGPPSVGRVILTQYASNRATWADLLRGRVDAIAEVGSSARKSLASSTTTKVFTYRRRYQWMLLLNNTVPALRSPAVRRALNTGIDRTVFVRDALYGEGVESAGPIWPKLWAAPELMGFPYDPKTAAATIAASGMKIRFRCIFRPEEARGALVLQRQLRAIGVELVLIEGDLKAIGKTIESGDWDSYLSPGVSGPSILRTFDWWHSGDPRKNIGNYYNATVDKALDTIRYAADDDQYRTGLDHFYREILQDPPAVFIAWTEGARAVSNRFIVPAKPDLDMIGTVRSWQLAGTGGVGTN